MDIKTLMEYIKENGRKRDEERDVLSDTIPSMGKPFTKKIIQENPNIPQDDVQDYIQNVKDDSADYMMGVGTVSPALQIAGKTATRFGGLLANKYGGRVKDLAEEYLPKGISDKVTDIYHAGKRVNNTDMMNSGAQEMGRIKALNELAEQKPRFEVPIDKSQKPFDLDVFQRNLDIQRTMEAQDAAKSMLRDSGIVEEETKALTGMIRKK